ncbi:MAG TPA: type I restriction enzyme HsdR N-terminal domain-containing protein [Candidatus Dormibacteraeota bacterium]|nr:type I restriction enzyme HsdR N-terminal domain-containing protein [Candidatus Dormibacteraeota bacterium]
MLSEIFGYEKYSDITSEHAIRGTFCDLALLLDGRIQILLEAKAIGIELKDSHVKQAVDYAANKGVDWVVLTNGTHWRIYRVLFAKPIDQDLVYEIDFLSVDTRKTEELELLFVLTKEAWGKQALNDLHQQRQVLSKFVIAAVTTTETVLEVIRRELRRICPDVKLQTEQIEQVLVREVLKREVVEGEKADEARKKVSRCCNRQLRSRAEKTAGEITPAIPLQALPVVTGSAAMDGPQPAQPAAE